MTATTLRKSMSADTSQYARTEAGEEHAGDLPRRSTRELEAVFAQEGGRWPWIGLALGLTVSAGLWAIIAAMVF